MPRIKPCSWGVLGTGWVAQRFIADMCALNGGQVTAVASRSPSRAASTASKFGVARSWATYEDLFTDDLVDIVYVASEHHEHAAHCLAALAAGKHVLCEKPFAPTLQETDDIIAAASKSGRFCMEAMWSRFLPGMLEAKRRVASGQVGTPKFLEVSFGSPVVETVASRFFDPARGGGALLDRGVYGIALAIGLFGRPTQVRATVDRHPDGADRTLSALLRFPDDAIAVCSASLGTYMSNQATISGTEGRLTLEEPFYRPERLRLSRIAASDPSQHAEFWPTSAKERVRKLAAAIKPFLPRAATFRDKIILRPTRGFGYGYEASETMRCIAEGLTESPIMPLHDTRLVAEVVQSIRTQIDQGP